MKTAHFSKTFVLIFFTVFLSACKPATETTSAATAEPETSPAPISEDQRLATFFEELFERDVNQSPEFQAYLGRKTEDYGRWDDYSEAHAETQNQQTQNDLKRLQQEFDFDALSENSKMSYRIFEYDQQQSLRNYQWRHHNYAISPMNDISSSLAAFLQNIHQIENIKDAEDYISRLEGIQTVLHEVVKQLQHGESMGVIPPKMVYPKVLPAAQNLLKDAPFEETAEDGVILADFRSKLEQLELEQEDKEILLNDAANALSGSFRNGYQELITELQRLQAIADNNHGIWSLPDGEAYYANRIQNWTTVVRPVDEIHELGLAEVTRIRAEMQQIMEEVGFEGDLAEFFVYVRNSPENYYEKSDAGREEYIRDATALINGIYDIADQYFNVLPKAPLEVRRVEPWREDGASTAFYDGHSPDGSRPGIYYINQKDMNAVQKHIQNSLAYHEGAPGHHFQIAIQQELQDIPQFRRFGGYSAYSEGWALYSERLAFEAGLYEGLPMRNFGRLAEEMKRAVRLVVDTGMHAKQWPLEQSIEYMTANTPMATDDIERQIKRYYVLPGQALSYKVGMLTILDLRQRAEQQLGEKYDIREFHDVVLKNGALPMQILGDVVDAYIQSKQDNPG